MSVLVFHSQKVEGDMKLKIWRAEVARTNLLGRREWQ